MKTLLKVCIATKTSSNSKTRIQCTISSFVCLCLPAHTVTLTFDLSMLKPNQFCLSYISRCTTDIISMNAYHRYYVKDNMDDSRTGDMKI